MVHFNILQQEAGLCPWTLMGVEKAGGLAVNYAKEPRPVLDRTGFPML